MHYHLEVIMPPSSDISTDLEQILGRFSEHEEDSDYPSFWDWYVIGGRWAGEKESCTYDPDKIQEFYDKLHELEVTVAGLTAGKRRLEPESQIPMVDELWCEFFPTENGEIVACPLFAHSNNQYDSNDLISCDICRVDEIPEKLSAARVIIAGPAWDGEGFQAEYMDTQQVWTGCNFLDTDWDGSVLSSLKRYEKYCERYTEEAREKYTPKPNWVCVTVDYHS